MSTVAATSCWRDRLWTWKTRVTEKKTRASGGASTSALLMILMGGQHVLFSQELCSSVFGLTDRWVDRGWVGSVKAMEANRIQDVFVGPSNILKHFSVGRYEPGVYGLKNERSMEDATNGARTLLTCAIRGMMSTFTLPTCSSLFSV